MGTTTARKNRISAKSQCIPLNENIFRTPEQGELLLTLADGPRIVLDSVIE
jgi:hypothetical protein